MERRAYPRINYECPVQLRDLTLQEKYILHNSFCKNVSQIGLKVVSFDFFPVEEKLRLKIFSEDNGYLMEVVGKIIWVQQYPHQHKYVLGVKFIDVGSTAYDKLGQLISGVTLKNPQDPGMMYNN